MRGQVLGVDLRTGQGQVAGEDGRRYVFDREDWAHHGSPAIGMRIDFAAEQDHARSIFPLPAPPLAYPSPPTGTPVSDRNRVVAALLAFFLGVLGMHRFYLGRTGSGVLMLLLTLTGLGVLATLPWSLVDTIRFLTMSDAEFAARYPR